MATDEPQSTVSECSTKQLGPKSILGRNGGGQNYYPGIQ